MADRVSPAKLSRPKLGQEVTRHLRDAIMSGEYQPGQRMAIEELARELGVSTMPVREALVALASEGLVEALANRGFRVTRMTRTDINDLFAVHALIAGLLAERAALTITDESLARLREIGDELEALPTRRMSKAERAHRAEELNWEFHRIINHAPPDASRLRWFMLVSARFIPRHFYKSIEGWLEGTVGDHPAILAALEGRDPTRAKRLMESHTLHARQLVVDYLDSLGMWRERSPHEPFTVKAPSPR